MAQIKSIESQAGKSRLNVVAYYDDRLGGYSIGCYAALLMGCWTLILVCFEIRLSYTFADSPELVADRFDLHC